jgi:hypothetical protein
MHGRRPHWPPGARSDAPVSASSTAPCARAPAEITYPAAPSGVRRAARRGRWLRAVVVGCDGQDVRASVETTEIMSAYMYGQGIRSPAAIRSNYVSSPTHPVGTRRGD